MIINAVKNMNNNIHIKTTTYYSDNIKNQNYIQTQTIIYDVNKVLSIGTRVGKKLDLFDKCLLNLKFKHINLSYNTPIEIHELFDTYINSILNHDPRFIVKNSNTCRYIKAFVSLDKKSLLHNLICILSTKSKYYIKLTSLVHLSKDKKILPYLWFFLNYEDILALGIKCVENKKDIKNITIMLSINTSNIFFNNYFYQRIASILKRTLHFSGFITYNITEGLKIISTLSVLGIAISFIYYEKNFEFKLSLNLHTRIPREKIHKMQVVDVMY